MADIKFKLSNFEVFSTTVGDPVFGIFKVTGIHNLSGAIAHWLPGITDGTELNGRFEGLTVNTVAGGPALFHFTLAGGTATIFNVPAGSYAPPFITGPPTTAAQICGGACPAPWLTLDFIPGIGQPDYLIGPGLRT